MTRRAADSLHGWAGERPHVDRIRIRSPENAVFNRAQVREIKLDGLQLRIPVQEKIGQVVGVSADFDRAKIGVATEGGVRIRREREAVAVERDEFVRPREGRLARHDRTDRRPNAVAVGDDERTPQVEDAALGGVGRLGLGLDRTLPRRELERTARPVELGHF